MPRKRLARPRCWRYSEQLRTAELLHIPQPSGRSAIAATVGAHIGVLVAPTLPHVISAAGGVAIGLLLRYLGLPRIMTIVSAVLVPTVAGLSPAGAEAIGYLDRHYLPTAIIFLVLTGSQQAAHVLYDRSAWSLVLPVFWKPKEEPASS